MGFSRIYRWTPWRSREPGSFPLNFLLSTIAWGWLSWFDDRVRVRSHILIAVQGYILMFWPRLD
ncbi:hypothetical protein CROQUDRAFT_658137 [Cronartium quercuum f. sp. fusiforme G11]|uniref:Uncharacterized protein n=1 Tax=Cronartium quercuum f. sp. fusiforme G11 TaxID=708437 RepID=A0A9P6TB46_9BASI|nr:hypothetical protein CROQUDRAFT_658137 [Cronartium quercuum f. sp. fusiforme G11]